MLGQWYLPDGTYTVKRELNILAKTSGGRLGERLLIDKAWPYISLLCPFI